MINWNVSPDIIDLGFFHLRWYGVLFATGVVWGFSLMRKIAVGEGVKLEEFEPALTYTVVGTVLGARLGHVFFYEPEVFLADPARILMVWEGGLASHGGAAGLCIALWFYCRKAKIPYLWWLDRVAVPSCIASTFIRLGNLMNSEIVGKVTDVPWAFRFGHLDNLPRHPAQLYEALFYFGLYWVLRYFYRNTSLRNKTGFILGAFLSGIFSFRFLIEFIKENQVMKEASMSLNIGQWLSIPTVAFGVFLMVRALMRGEQFPYKKKR